MSDKVLPTIYNFNFNTVFLSNETVHLLDDFKCGAGEIDRYVKEDALNDCMSGKGVTYLVIDNSSERLVAYYTLSATSLIYVEDYDITDKSNFNDIKIRGIPSIEIKMFAVNNSYQDILLHHEEHGEKLISDVILGSVIGGIYDIAIKILGAEMIVLNSVPDAVDFYIRNNFLPIDEQYRTFDDDYTNDCMPMYMILF